MSDWKKTKYPKGTEVHVNLVDDNSLAIGHLLNDYDEDDSVMPYIELTDGRKVYGYECFWIPVEEVPEDIRKKFEDKVKESQDAIL